MACRTDSTDKEIAADKARARARLEEEFTHNSHLAEIFCATMKVLQRNGKNLPESMPSAAIQWWDEHQERDRQKIEAKKILDQIRKNSDKQAALAKLSDYERELLGLK